MFFSSYGYPLLAVTVTATMLFAACQEDPIMDARSHGSTVCFDPMLSDEWNKTPNTRSGDGKFKIDTTYVIKVDNATPEGEPLYVHVEVMDGIESPTMEALSADESQTRGGMVTADNFHTSFAAFADAYTSWNGTKDFNLMNNLKVEASKNWATDVKWPKHEKSVVFYGYAPHQDDLPVGMITYKSRRPADSDLKIPNGDGLVLQYTYQSKKHVDFVVGGTGAKTVSDMASTGKKPAMQFHHPFAAIKVKAGSVFDRCYLQILGFLNIFASGTLTFNAGGEYTKWTNLGNKRTVNLVTYDDAHWVDPGGNMVSGDPTNDTYFAIPQQLSDEVKLQITYSKTGSPSDFENVPPFNIGKDASGNFVKWEAGKTYTYTISKKPDINWDYTFEVAGNTNANNTPEVMLHSWKTQQDISVKSYSIPSDGSGQKSVDWSYEYSTDGGKTWAAATGGSFANVLKVFGGSKSAPAGNGSNHALKATVAFPETFINEYDNQISNAGEEGNGGNYYDLSTKGGKVARNTANCYVVNRGGYYKIPLVWGNAIKNGGKNESAYKMTGRHQNTKAVWLTYKGNSISDPWITKQYSFGQTLKGVIEWMDIQDLVEGLSIEYNTSGENYLRFHVNPNKAKQGNAVISLTESGGTVIWSWHIWVTTYKPGETTVNSDWNNPLVDREIINNSGKRYKMMAIPLGHVMGATRRIESNSILLKFKQNDSGLERRVKVLRYGGLERKPGHTPLYQYGRHVPVPGGVYTGTNPGSWDKVKPVTTWGEKNKGQTQIYQATGTVVTTDLIKNPHTIYHTESGMGPIFTEGERLRNRWDMACRGDSEGSGDYGNNGNAEHTIKSVYDPSPAGYSMPTRDAFTGFCKAGTTQTGPNYKDWSTPFKYENEFYAEYGCHFRIHVSSADNQTLMLPSTGWRNPGYDDSSGNSLQGTANQARYWTATYDKNSEKPYSLYFSITNAKPDQPNFEGKIMYINTRELTNLSECIGVIPVRD